MLQEKNPSSQEEEVLVYFEGRQRNTHEESQSVAWMDRKEENESGWRSTAGNKEEKEEKETPEWDEGKGGRNEAKWWRC